MGFRAWSWTVDGGRGDQGGSLCTELHCPTRCWKLEGGAGLDRLKAVGAGRGCGSCEGCGSWGRLWELGDTLSEVMGCAWHAPHLDST